MSLFPDFEPKTPTDAPLPERLRPASLADVVGLHDLLGEGRFLRNAIESDRIPSMIFWGPPGSGKTTLARIIAKSTRARFVPFSATSTSIKDIKALMEEARKSRGSRGVKTIVFIDEIHRFNKAQQDAFLPYVEAGDIVLIGATTENPSFEVNSALLSRCKVVVIPQLERAEVMAILRRAVADPSVRKYKIELTDDALDFIAATSAGDARQALNSLQLVVETASQSPIDAKQATSILQRRRRRVRVLAGADARGRRGPDVNRPPPRARRVRGHRQRRPASARAGDRRPANRALPRHARSRRRPRAAGDVPSRRPEVECRVRGLRRSRARSPPRRQPTRPPPHPQRSHPPHEGSRLRPRLRVRARLRGTDRRHGMPPRGAVRPPLLRAQRGGHRSRDQSAPGANAGGAEEAVALAVS